MDDAKRQAALAVLAKAQEEAAAADQAHDDLVLELRARFTGELGREGMKFVVVNEDNAGGVGPVVLKLIDSTHHKMWVAGDSTPESQFKYVKPAVAYPAEQAFAQLAVERPVILMRCVVALDALFGAKRGDVQKKF